MTQSLLTILFPIVTFMISCGQIQPAKQNKPNNIIAPPVRENDIIVGGFCDECEIMYEGMPPIEKIGWETTIANKTEPGERMEINGTVFMRDGNTPAKNIILYIYHTSSNGYYESSDTQTLGRRHGHLRGWVQTNSHGKFKFHSIRPAPYPNRNSPAHIHMLVKEPGKSLYYIDEVWFDDDPLISKKLNDESENRGGNLIIPLSKNKDDFWSGNLSITLGLNIPDYK